VFLWPLYLGPQTSTVRHFHRWNHLLEPSTPLAAAAAGHQPRPYASCLCQWSSSYPLDNSVAAALQVHELGASIIHGANRYLLDLAREMNLTLTEGDDTDAAFSIWDGKGFVFSQVGGGVRSGTDSRHLGGLNLESIGVTLCPQGIQKPQGPCRILLHPVVELSEISSEMQGRHVSQVLRQRVSSVSWQMQG